MFELLLFALSWTVEPSLIDQSTSSKVAPAPTCVRPMGKLIVPKTDHAPLTARITDEETTWLRNWEQATRNAPAWNRSKREEFRRSIYREFNQHTAIAAEQFVGCINAEQLIEIYEWNIVERQGDRVLLSATPRDETERLFYGSFRVWLSTTDGNADQIVAVGRNHAQLTIWQNASQLPPNGIHLAHFTGDLPPAPKPLVRIADSRAD